MEATANDILKGGYDLAGSSSRSAKRGRATGAAGLKGGKQNWRHHAHLCRVSDVCLSSVMLPHVLCGLAAKAGADKLEGRCVVDILDYQQSEVPKCYH